MAKLFSKSFEERRLFEKRRHPKTFIIFYQCVVFKQCLIRRPQQAPCRKARFQSGPHFRGCSA
ncbi:hypothetical protein CFR75_02655 [Komagataeibacter xylinus]|uniref:Uncharacterized protein n=1 Tax=Komagataeibacter xylinus TaxID=28448 RepID=A0A318PMD6_KOMXY|nr:hypothetical protein CXP35_01545 [Komagataeibacter xylinus]PYD58290.1 hypothetical protein CFR75_02655 [Komagataeibacter xylinus]